MNAGSELATVWPAHVIHVNEDGWVLINRGTRHGVIPGLRLLVVGDGIRPLRDLYGNAATGDGPVLRIRRTYELLEVIHAEDQCAVAIAARAPADRRPTIFHGPEGELLVWTPLPPSYTYQFLAGEDAGDNTGDEADAADMDTADESAPNGSSDEEASDDVDVDINDGAHAEEDDIDVPPQLGEQEDKRWEEALPLNGTAVGDLVVPAIPAGPGVSAIANYVPQSITADPATSEPHASTPYDTGRSYDWIKPSGE